MKVRTLLALSPMKKVILLAGLLFINSTAFAESSLSEAVRSAEILVRNKDQVKLIKAIGCVKFGDDCPRTTEGKDEIYEMVASETNKVLRSGNAQERQEALQLLQLATSYHLSQ
jgi:hypothetical protein